MPRQDPGNINARFFRGHFIHEVAVIEFRLLDPSLLCSVSASSCCWLRVLLFTGAHLLGSGFYIRVDVERKCAVKQIPEGVYIKYNATFPPLGIVGRISFGGCKTNSTGAGA